MTNDQLLKLDMQLACALGYYDVSLADVRELWCYDVDNEDGFWQMCWTQDNDEAFKLMCEYEIPVIAFDDAVHANGLHKEIYTDHKDRCEATRVAIVKAVIEHLKDKS